MVDDTHQSSRTDGAAAGPYRVLARKYRPAGFEDLIGQGAMVKTLSNAFALDRIHQAYILTGVRGVGKTTTARILARAFNYQTATNDRPTITMPELGEHCQAIIESRHVDVIEMDAASHTGIDDVREIIESARYRPVLARTKVYIIDEVHMLSKAAFNGLLKTLEEPPEHVKFLFATTEIDKVPITVRSRCQRFDLRRVEADVMIAHLARICAQEAAAVDEDALALVARAAEGSVRDALSLLDQAIAQGMGAAAIDAGQVRAMLGLADRALVIDLFEALMRGDVAAALALMREQFNQGADPGQVLVELADFTHLVTRLKHMPEAAADPGLTQEERVRGAAFAAALSMPVLSRAWQILLRGVQDVKDSPRPLAAADMALVRLAYAADLPSPSEALRRIAAGPDEAPARAAIAARAEPALAPPNQQARRLVNGPDAVMAPVPVAASVALVAPAARIERFADLIARAQAERDIQLKTALECDVRLIRFEEGSIEFALAPGASPQLAQQLMRKLQTWTGARWMVAISSAEGAPTLQQQAAASKAREAHDLHADPFVRGVLERFPGAQIVGVRGRPELDAPAPAGDEHAYGDPEHAYGDITSDDESEER